MIWKALAQVVGKVVKKPDRSILIMAAANAEVIGPLQGDPIRLLIVREGWGTSRNLGEPQPSLTRMFYLSYNETPMERTAMYKDLYEKKAEELEKNPPVYPSPGDKLLIEALVRLHRTMSSTYNANQK